MLSARGIIDVRPSPSFSMVCDDEYPAMQAVFKISPKIRGTVLMAFV